MSKEAIILKSDAAGRVLVPLDRQVELVREFERSGLSGPRFAEIAGVKYQTFAAWRRKHGSLPPPRRSRMSSPPIPSASWLEAAVEPAGDTSILVRLPGGATMELSHPGQAHLAVQLLRAIAATPC
jgi:hypothetical protein